MGPQSSSISEPESSKNLLRNLLLVLAVVTIMMVIFLSALQGSRGMVNIPITGNEAQSTLPQSNALAAGETTPGWMNLFFQPGVLGLLETVTGTLIFGLSVLVLSRQRR